MVKNSLFSRKCKNDYEGSVGNLCNDEIAAISNERLKCFKNKSAAEMAEKMMGYM